MTTRQQDAAFLAEVISNSLLELAIDWISRNLSPEDVFSDSDLIIWAERNGYQLEGDDE